MGTKSEDITSGPLSSAYSSYYKELQVRNWTHVDIVVTESNGSQFLIPAAKNILEPEASVEIEFRSHNGMRCAPTEFGMKEQFIPGKRHRIAFSDIRNSPYKVPDYNLIISTYDHAGVAAEMLCANNHNPLVYETSEDCELFDPRMVFQVIDPCNRWSKLLVNVFGQTMIIRAGHWSSTLPFGNPNDAPKEPETGRLICYLRYPNDYYNGANTLTTVFEITLENLDQEEPITLPNGDVICVAPEMDALQRIMAKKATGCRGQIPANIVSSKMIPKEIYDAAQENSKKELERVKQDAATKLETTVVNKNNEIAKLQGKLEKVTQEKEALEIQVTRWENLHKADSTALTNNADAMAAIEKARQESLAASRKDIDNMWNILKIAGGLAAAAVSFGITVIVKTKK